MIYQSLKNPYLVGVVALALSILGLISYFLLPADLLPIFKTPAVQVITFYPGMPSEVMEKDITSRIERWTGQANGIEHQEAKSMIGVSIVKDFFHEHIDANTAMSQVTSLAMSDLFYLPPGTIPPMVMPFDPTASVPLCLLAVSSNTMTEKELYDVAYFQLRNKLQAISGVIAPAVYGGKLRRILTYVDREKLQARNLSPMDIVETLNQFNLMIPTGNAKFGELDYQINSNAMVEHVPEFDDFPVKNKNGAMVFMKDVGEAKDSSQIQTNIVRINGRRQVYVPIYRQPGANTIYIVNEVKKTSALILQRIREEDPKAQDLRLDVVMDQSLTVKESIDNLQIAGLIGAVLAALVVLLFLRSFRGTVIILIALPISILTAFLGLRSTGDTINSMTLGGLTLAVGILLDQSIVVLDNILRHIRLGKTSKDAALVGAKEVAGPVLVSTLTFLAVFCPIIFLTGMAGFLFKPLAIAAIFTIIASYVISITLIPNLGAKLFQNTKFTTETEKESLLKKAYEKLLWASIKLRWPLIILVLTATAFSFIGLQKMGTELFPQINTGQFTILIRGYTGMSLDKSEELIEEVEAEILKEMGQPDPENKDKNSDLQIVISNIGVLMDWPAAYTPNAGTMDSFVLVQLKDHAKKSALEWAEYFRHKFRKRFPGIEFAFDTGGILTAALNFGLPSPINIQVEGSQLEISHEIAHAIFDEIRDIHGTRDTRIYQRLDYPVINIKVDRQKASMMGVSQDIIVKNIVTALNSSINFKPSFWIDERNGNHYFLGAQYFEKDIESIETLENIPIRISSGKTVLLKNVATFSRKAAPATVTHLNITRVIDLYVNVYQQDIGSIVKKIEEKIQISPTITKLMEKYSGKGYRIHIRGEYQRMQESFEQFKGGLVLAIILVYLVLVVQFRSYRDPLLIMLSVPFSFIGITLVLMISNTYLNIPAFMGIIMSVGMVVEYSVLLVEFANRLRAEGMDKQKAIVEAAKVRFTPVLMTSLTTALALLPMALNIGNLGGANQPLALTMLGGVVAAFILTLIVLPPFYVLLASNKTHSLQEN